MTQCRNNSFFEVTNLGEVASVVYKSQIDTKAFLNSVKFEIFYDFHLKNSKQDEFDDSILAKIEIIETL